MGLPADFRAEADERYRALLESAPDAMVIVDDTGIIRLVNAQTELMFGYSRDDLVGRTVEFLVPRRFRRASAAVTAISRARRCAPWGRGWSASGCAATEPKPPVEISSSNETEDGLLVSPAARDASHARPPRSGTNWLAPHPSSL